MPLFDYKCTECGYTEEELVPLDAPQTMPCDCLFGWQLPRWIPARQKLREWGVLKHIRKRQPCTSTFVLNWTDPMTGEDMKAPVTGGKEVWGVDTDGLLLHEQPGGLGWRGGSGKRRDGRGYDHQQRRLLREHFSGEFRRRRQYRRGGQS